MSERVDVVILGIVQEAEHQPYGFPPWNAINLTTGGLLRLHDGEPVIPIS